MYVYVFRTLRREQAKNENDPRKKVGSECVRPPMFSRLPTHTHTCPHKHPPPPPPPPAHP